MSPAPRTAAARPRTPRTAAAVLASACLLVPAACADSDAPGSGSGPGGTTEVTVAIDWTPNTNHSGLYLAEQRGYFEDAGLTVTIVEPGDVGSLDLLATGDADFAYSFAEGLAPAVAQGVDAVSVATVIQHNTSSLIFENSSGITRPADLADHVYGTYGSPLEIALVEALVSCDGGDPSALQTAPLASQDVRIGLEQDQFDFAWVFDAWDTIRLRDVDAMDVGTIPFIEHTDCIPDWYTPLIATSQAYLDAEPEAASAFLEALAHGYADAMTEPDAAAEAIVTASPELDPQLVELSAEYLAENYASSPEEWGAQDGQVWDEFIAFLAEHDLEGGDVDPATLWTSEVLGR